MLELEAFSVAGLRCLADVQRIPVRKPTIITGANDGGKSSTILALRFLLGDCRLSASDHTLLGPTTDGQEALRTEQVVVTGFFHGAVADEVASDIQIRRVRNPDGTTPYELRSHWPVDPRLRGIHELGLADLRSRAAEFGLDPDGRANAKASWLAPLEELAAREPQEEAWIPAPRELVDQMPMLLAFSSTDEPNPEAQVHSVLKTVFTELLKNEELLGPVRRVEAEVQSELAKNAASLCEHVKARCPELDDITIVPDVTFREGFQRVEVLTARAGTIGIPLNQSGAGRQRRINLAIWEWAAQLLEKQHHDGQAVVIAYDEPDTHLDYSHQRELVNLIRSQCSGKNVRMVVATHSLNLIDRVDIADVVHLWLEGGATRVERLIDSDHESIETYLTGVSQAMGLRNSVLLHERFFLGVEGPTELQAVPVLFRLATGMSLQSAGIALIAGNSNDGALRVVEFLKANGRRMAFLLVDADSAENKVFRPDKLQRAGVDETDIHFVGNREIEDLFSDEQWARTANAEWPRVDGAKWASDNFATLRVDGGKFSQGLEEMVRSQSEAAPSGKPGYLVALAQGLSNVDDLPTDLVQLFSELSARANE